MENALYYTLRTIAQTLAGALAILVAVGKQDGPRLREHPRGRKPYVPTR